MKKKIKVVVLGEGAWGTALATVLDGNGHEVVMWCHDAEIATEINTHHTNNRYMPGFKLPPTLIATHDGADAVRDAKWICEAIPVQYMRSVITLLKTYVPKNIPWIITSKGIEQETLLFPAELVTHVLGYEPEYGLMLGPSFAREVMKKKQTGVAVVAHTSVVQKKIAALFTNEYFICVESNDVKGAQLCAAFKNVVAVLVGVSDGQGNGENARALLITRCFQKMVSLVHACGGSVETIYGLAGIGDLFLTVASTQSRNYLVGKALGNGESLESIIQRTGFTPEGVNTLQSIEQYAKRYGISLADMTLTL